MFVLSLLDYFKIMIRHFFEDAFIIIFKSQQIKHRQHFKFILFFYVFTLFTYLCIYPKSKELIKVRT